ncbi:MAG: transporter substrate-binding domain-containing protein [Kangiellaceae bacterium]|nr:transporter substrate-binding domain-containing protein [Kangiellaceae bacterium]
MNKLIRSLLFLVFLVVFSCSQQEPNPSDSNLSESNQSESATEISEEVSIKSDPKEISQEGSRSVTQLEEEAACELILGWDPWEPYQYLTPDDQVKGLEIELIQSMARQVGCSVKFEQGEWMALLESLELGKIDMLGGASKTDARKTFAHFSIPYRHESFVLYLLAENMEIYAEKSIYELMDEKFRLGITDDYIYGDAISLIQDKKSYQSQIVTVPITEVNYYNLMQGNIDGFLEDPFVAGYTIKRKGLSAKISASGIKVHSGDVSIMFSKASVTPERVEQFNMALESIKNSGEYKKILDKYSH